MQKIVVPTDFSPIAANAFDYAIELAARFESALCLYHVYRFRKKADYDWDYPADEQPFIKSIEERMEFSKKKFIGKIKEYGISLQTVVERSDVFILFKHTVIEQNFNLVVMGSKGASGLEKVIFGSVAATALDLSKVPVLVVPPKSTFVPIKHIVLALDRKEISAELLIPLQQLAAAFEAKVTVLTIKSDTEQEAAPRSDIALQGVDIAYREIPLNGSINVSIQAYLDTNSCDLLCMVKREKGFFDSIFKKSITKAQVYDPRTPFLVIPE